MRNYIRTDTLEVELLSSGAHRVEVIHKDGSMIEVKVDGVKCSLIASKGVTTEEADIEPIPERRR